MAVVSGSGVAVGMGVVVAVGLGVAAGAGAAEPTVRCGPEELVETGIADEPAHTRYFPSLVFAGIVSGTQKLPLLDDAALP